MKYTVAHTMDEVERLVPPSLVGPAAWARARTAAERLPAALAGAFYLECRLAATEAPVDWIVRVDEPGREVLAGRNPRVALPPALRADGPWARLARFAAAWADDPDLRRTVQLLWLELDLDAEGDLPHPSVFAALDPRGVAGFATADWTALLDRLLEYLGPDPASPATRRALHAALAERPPEGRPPPFPGAGEWPVVPYVGFMLARPVPAVRLYLARTPAAELPARLRAMGWPGAPGELDALLRRLDGPTPGVAPAIGMSHLDVHDGSVLPRVGMEFTFERARQVRGTLAEAAFLDRLVALGLCTGAKRRGLLSWPGHSLQTLRHELWRSVLSRRVNCVKLVHEPGRAPHAKGYLLTYWAAAAAARAAAAHARASPGSME
ncbi:MAG TPA: hypothetical protein VFX98_07985 [Longimicrobiaceae bacterium]|nr:hypothetical protein [Longimicrobiaceae bacterium]